MFIEYAILVVYFTVLFIIGIVASRRIHGLKDYYVGGKKLGYWVVAFSARATGESGWLLLGLTGMGALMGMSAFWVVAGELLGVGIAWFVMARPFKRLTDRYDSITIPDYLESRFRTAGHALRIVAATALCIFVTIYVSAQINATGVAFETFLEMDFYWGALLGFFIVLIYIFSGGFVAVSWSDLFQGLMMLFGLLILPFAAYFAIEEKGAIVSGLRQIDPALLDIWGEGGFSLLNLLTVAGFLFIGLGFLGSPQIFVRFISINGEREIDKGQWVAIFFTLLTDTAAVCIGILGRYLFTEAGRDPEALLGNAAENVLPLMVENLFPALIIGIYIAVILSAIMSTIDSLLVVASSAVVRDFYQKVFHPELEERNLSAISRWVTVLLALLALGIALTVAYVSPNRTIFWFVVFGWSGIAATFCPTIILSLFYKKFTEAGAIASMIAGFVCVPLFKFGAPALPVVGEYFAQLSEMFPSFAIAIIAGIVVSALQPDPELERQFEGELKNKT